MLMIIELRSNWGVTFVIDGKCYSKHNLMHPDVANVTSEDELNSIVDAYNEKQQLESQAWSAVIHRPIFLNQSAQLDPVWRDAIISKILDILNEPSDDELSRAQMHQRLLPIFTKAAANLHKQIKQAMYPEDTSDDSIEVDAEIRASLINAAAEITTKKNQSDWIKVATCQEQYITGRHVLGVSAFDIRAEFTKAWIKLGVDERPFIGASLWIAETMNGADNVLWFWGRVAEYANLKLPADIGILGNDLKAAFTIHSNYSKKQLIGVACDLSTLVACLPTTLFKSNGVQEYLMIFFDNIME